MCVIACYIEPYVIPYFNYMLEERKSSEGDRMKFIHKNRY